VSLEVVDDVKLSLLNKANVDTLSPTNTSYPTTTVAATVTIVDSGASRTLVNSTADLQCVQPPSGEKLGQADGSPLEIIAQGPHTLSPTQAHVAPTLVHNLVSWGALEKSGLRYVYDKSMGDLRHWVDPTGKPVLSARLDPKSNLFIVLDSKEFQHTLSAAKASKLWTTVARPGIQKLILLLHIALGHISEERLVNVVKKKLIANLPSELTVKAIRKYFPQVCKACIQGKSIKVAPTQRPKSPVPDSPTEDATPLVTAVITRRGHQRDNNPFHALEMQEDEECQMQEDQAKQGEPQAQEEREAQGEPEAQTHLPPLSTREVEKEGEIERMRVSEKEVDINGDEIPEYKYEVICCDIDDVAGKNTQDVSRKGYRYAAIFRGKNGRTMRIKFMSSRADLPDAIRSVLEEYKAYDKIVSALKVDNEYAGTAISMLATEFKTHLHYCAPNEHFQNGSAEQAVQEVDRTGRATLFSADPSFPRSEWPEAYSFVEMVHNHTTESCIEGVSAEEWLTGEKPDARRFAYIPFGVAVQGLVNKEELDKLDSRTFAGWNLGPAPHHQQCIRIYDPATEETKIRRSYWVTSQYAEDGLVVDLESSIPDKAPDLPTLQQHSRAARKRAESARKKAIRDGAASLRNVFRAWRAIRARRLSAVAKATEIGAKRLERANSRKAQVAAKDSRSGKTKRPVPEKKKSHKKAKEDKSTKAARKGSTKRQNAALDTAIGHNQYAKMYATKGVHRRHERFQASAIFIGNAYPVKGAKPAEPAEVPTFPMDDLLETGLGNLPPPIFYQDPKGWKQMEKHPSAQGFMRAVEEEMNMHATRGTGKQVRREEIPKGTRTYNSMFQFRTKRDRRGIFQRYKARLCFRGDQQDKDDIGETYSSCVKSEVVRLLLALAAALDMEVSSLDITGAFLVEQLPSDKIIYMRLPMEYTKGKEVIWRLDLSLYGLCEAPRIFQQGLRTHLETNGFTASSFDPCLFRRSDADGKLQFAATHVDDLLIFSFSKTAAQSFKVLMETKYEITWHNQAQDFLGYSIARDRGARTLTISQPGYARHVVHEAGLGPEDNAMPSPGDAYRTPSVPDSGVPDKARSTRLRKLVGLLQYLTNTRIDILTELNRVAKNMDKPSPEDVIAAERIIRYISGTLDYGLTLGGSEDTTLYAWADAAFESEKDGYSRSGMVFSIGQNSGAFLAKSFTQWIRSLSTQESEIQSLSEATRYIMFFRYLLEELGIPQSPTIIYEDNNAAISFAKGQGDYDRTKHISRHFRFCADQVRANTIVVERIDTDKQRADQQTKILDPYLHKQHTAVNLNLKNQVQFREDI